MTDSIFTVDGDRFVPTELARGPWDRRFLHGGAPAALLARVLALAAPERLTARLSVDFLRPAPLAPFSVRTSVVGSGRQVQRTEAILEAEGRVVARAVAVQLRRKPVDLPADPPERPGEVAPTPLEQSRPSDGPDCEPYAAFHDGGMEIRFVAGRFREPGPAKVWFRFARPLLDGEAPLPLSRVAAACDFGNGVAAPLPWATHTFLNADLGICLYREPVGEWIYLDAVTRPGPDGVALGECQLHDASGHFGHSQQTVLLEARQG